MTRGGAALWVLAAGPLLLLAAALPTFVAVWRTPGTDPAGAAGWPELAARVCPADALLVMGAAQYDGTPSAAFERRLAGAERLHRAGCAPLVVVSGGARPGDRTTEGASGVAWLERRGLPAAALRVEERATTSVENLAFASALLPAARWVVVTDDLHVRRTAAVAERLGLEAEVVGVRSGGDRVRYALRETAAMLAYRLGVFR